ncbi:uncharacterized protein LOC101737863 [Bombyx mori]|uniref:CHK kinase-like domain-containing protein n=1 Tax=Bombyx mori TaxID=7091 RepID=A0A8R2AL53_BOMMO|nr:uncharacterized protein LOC101737863 [Bombyx mori]
MSEITLDFLQALLKDEYPDVILRSFEGAPGSKRGDNYTSMVYRIALKGIQNRVEPDGSCETETPWEGSIIYKRLPESTTRREAFKSDELFCNEIAFYNKIWPALFEFQNRWGIEEPFKSVPKCYLARDNCVLLKDLKQFGFVMPDRKVGLSVDQTYFVLRHLAHFHALSLAMKGHDPEAFHELWNSRDGISEVFFVSENDDYYRNYYHEAIQNAIAMVDQELQGTDSKDQYLDRFKEFCSEETFFKTMVELVEPCEPLGVICHGDCWTNNFLFRYENENIAEMCIVDFQLVRYASPALDLVYIMYLCLERQQRALHLTPLLRYYADQLFCRAAELSGGGVVCGGVTSDVLFQMLHKDFRQKSRFGLGIALDMYPITTCDSDEAPNLYSAEDSGRSQGSEPAPGARPVRTSSAACRRKMTDLVKELVDQGLL